MKFGFDIRTGFLHFQSRLEQDDEDFPLISSIAEDSLLGVPVNNTTTNSCRNSSNGHPAPFPAHWDPDHVDYAADPVVSGVVGVGLAMRPQVLDGGFIDDDDIMDE